MRVLCVGKSIRKGRGLAESTALRSLSLHCADNLGIGLKIGKQNSSYNVLAIGRKKVSKRKTSEEK